MIDNLVKWIDQKPMWAKVIFWLLLGWLVAVIVILAWPARKTFASINVHEQLVNDLSENIKNSQDEVENLKIEEKKISQEMEEKSNARDEVDKAIDCGNNFDDVDRIAKEHLSRRASMAPVGKSKNR